MERAGINVVREEREGRLIVATPDQTYLKHGVFEPEKMIEGLKEQVQSALDDGFAAFRGTGELGWAAELPSALFRLYEYEELFDANLSASFVALCQYSESLFRADIVSHMLRIHPKVVARGQLFTNPFYVGAGPASKRRESVNLEQLVEAGACV